MERRPNILFILSDQQRADSMGCYGQKLDVTPNLDRLSREGVKFEHAMTPQPVCGPARSCLQTGRYASETGCFINRRPLKENELTIAKELKKSGYETAYVGKWHLASDHHANELYIDRPIPQHRRGGYDDYVAMVDVLEFTSHGYDGYVFDKDGNKMEFTGYRPDCLTDYAISYVHKKTSDKPFFLFISYIEPHQQNDTNLCEGPDGSKRKFKDYDIPQDLLVGEYPGDWRENYADYLGSCHSLDYNVGRLVDTLKEKGMYDDTVIIYTSDHGNHFRTREGEYKRQCFDSCLRVPLIMRGGLFRGGKTYTEPVSIINLPPTVMDLAGLPVPSSMPEQSLNDLVRGEAWTEDVYYQISEAELARGIRTKRWKYCVHAPHKQEVLRMAEKFDAKQYHAMLLKALPASDSYVEQYLFDLANDPIEAHNLIGDPQYAEVRKDLKKMLKAHMVKAGEQEAVIHPFGTPLDRLKGKE